MFLYSWIYLGYFLIFYCLLAQLLKINSCICYCSIVASLPKMNICKLQLIYWSKRWIELVQISAWWIKNFQLLLLLFSAINPWSICFSSVYQDVLTVEFISAAQNTLHCYFAMGCALNLVYYITISHFLFLLYSTYLFNALFIAVSTLHSHWFLMDLHACRFI